jgi:hypothetical protein
MQTADPHLTYKLMNPNKRKWYPSILICSPNTSGRPILPRNPAKSFSSLLEGNETGRVGGTDTGTTVLDGLAVWLLESGRVGKHTSTGAETY